MGPFTSNMYNHITLQAKGTAIYFTVKESYIQNQQMNKKKNNRFHKNFTTIKQEEKSHQVHFHIYHSVEHHWGQLTQLSHVYLQACYTCEPENSQ